jgi:hypothetical protein
LLRQGDPRAALSRVQQLPALMTVQAGVVITQGRGDTDHRYLKAISVKGCVGVEPGHGLSDFSD